MNVQTASIAELRDEEKRCMAKFDARARKLMERDSRMSIDVARGKAIEMLPRCAAHYLEARSRLTLMGIRPRIFDEA